MRNFLKSLLLLAALPLSVASMSPEAAASGDLRWVDVDLEDATRSGEFLLDDDKKIPLFYEPGQKTC